MTILRSRSFAVLVLVAAIVFSVLFGSHRSLIQARAPVDALWDNVQQDLTDCRNIGANLLTVAGRYLTPAQTAALSLSIAELDEQESKAALNALFSASEQVLASLDSAHLTEADSRHVQSFRVDLAAQRDTLSRDPYNQMAKEFNETVLGAFPAKLLAPLTGVRPAETF